MTIPILRRVALAAALVTAAAVLPGLPAYAAGTGTIAGMVTTSSGTAAADVAVQVYLEDNNGNIEPVASTTTDVEGRYEVGSLDTGTYLVGFEPPEGPTQFYRQQRELWEADRLTVTDNFTTNAHDQLLPTGVITGVIRTAAGAPVADLLLTAQDVTQGNRANGMTDADGRYRIVTFPGTYTVSFQPVANSHQTQYIPGQIDESAARQVVVTAGGETVADDDALPTGTLAGRFTTETGAGIARAEVSFYTAGSGDYASSRTANLNGEFSINLLAGSYRVGFTDNVSKGQYYQGKLEFEEATPVSVTGGQTTTITDSWLGTGSVRVTAVDAVSGATIPDFCVNDVCSNGTGSVTVTDLPQGQHDLNVYTDDPLHFNADVNGVQIDADTTRELTVRLRPAAAITTTVIDRQAGVPLMAVCLNAFLRKQARDTGGGRYCSDESGRVTIGPLEPGLYRLFTASVSSAYGRQWVGATGGTGDERQAAVVAARASRIVSAPQVKLDPAGAIVGQVTDAATGQPLAGAGVALLSSDDGTGAEYYTDDQGRYRVDELGPYEWPLLFHRSGYAAHWSGGTADRYTAARVRVTPGGSATHDTALTRGTTVTGTLKNAAGVVAKDGTITARNATTGDITGVSGLPGGPFSMQVLAGQSVYFSYDTDFGEQHHQGQYPLPPSTRGRPGGPALATPGIPVPASGPLTVDIVADTN